MKTDLPHHQPALHAKGASLSQFPVSAQTNKGGCPVVTWKWEWTPFGTSSSCSFANDTRDKCSLWILNCHGKLNNGIISNKGHINLITSRGLDSYLVRKIDSEDKLVYYVNYSWRKSHFRCSFSMMKPGCSQDRKRAHSFLSIEARSLL